MQIQNSKFHKVWSVEIDQNGNKKIDLGDSKKNQDNSYFNWTWKWCRLVGNAKGVHLEKGDTITIKSGKIDQYIDQNGNYKNSVTIFDLEVTAKNQGYGNNQQPSSQSYQKPQNQGTGNFEDDEIPF